MTRQHVCNCTNFNPRTPRGVRLRASLQDAGIDRISIHAPREGCDRLTGVRSRWTRDFNPRTPRGVRLDASGQEGSGLLFQSTHPARGATPQAVLILYLDAVISIHAPREGCDERLDLFSALRAKFQSTHPARGATANFTKEQRVCLAQFAYLHKGKKAEHTKTNAPMLHEAFLYAFWVRTGRRRRVLLDFARYKIKGSSGR